MNTKGEYHIISGRINDIAWDGDSQRIIAVGDGRERFGHCITADSGNSVGEISGHSSIINAVSVRQMRPLRAATASDDTSMVFLNGAPFKFASKVGDLHKGYVYGVAFSPDGSTLVTVGADKRIQLYDGKTGEATKQIGEGEHTGSIFSVSWSKDSKKFVTASADQTIKAWDVDSGKAIQSWRFGGDGGISVSDQQVGVVWPHGRTDGLIISLNLAGDLIYLKEGESKPVKIVQGHNRSITALGNSYGSLEGTLVTGSFEGKVCRWDVASGVGTTIDGQAHSNQVAAITSAAGRADSVGWDDTLRSIDLSAATFLGSTIKLSAQPKGISGVGKYLYVATVKGLEVFSSGKQVSELPIPDFTPTTIAASKAFVAVGADNNQTRIFSIDSNNKLSPAEKLSNSTSPITHVAFSPDGSLLAQGNSSGKIVVYDTKSWEVVTDRWGAHTARITSIAWNAAGTHAASGSLDTNLHVWSLKSPGKRVKAPNAHKDGVNGVIWVDEGKVASVGGDAAVKIWKVEGLS